MDTKLWQTSLTSNTSICDIVVKLALIDDGKWLRIANKIGALWGTKGCHVYIQSLLFDDRHDRQGFPLQVLQLIYQIDHEHRAFYEPPVSVWDTTLLR